MNFNYRDLVRVSDHFRTWNGVKLIVIRSTPSTPGTFMVDAINSETGSFHRFLHHDLILISQWNQHEQQSQ